MSRYSDNVDWADAVKLCYPSLRISVSLRNEKDESWEMIVVAEMLGARIRLWSHDGKAVGRTEAQKPRIGQPGTDSSGDDLERAGATKDGTREDGTTARLLTDLFPVAFTMSDGWEASGHLWLVLWLDFCVVRAYTEHLSQSVSQSVSRCYSDFIGRSFFPSRQTAMSPCNCSFTA